MCFNYEGYVRQKETKIHCWLTELAELLQAVKLYTADGKEHLCVQQRSTQRLSLTGRRSDTPITPKLVSLFVKQLSNRLMNEALQGKEMHPQIVIPMTNFVWITIPLLLKAFAFDGRTQLVVQDNRHSNAVKVGGWETHIKSYTIFYFSFADGEVVASKST